MSKGGDQTTSSTTSSLPAYAEPYYKDLLKKAKTVSSQGYTPYKGERLANFSGDTEDAFDMVRANAAGGTPAVDAGIDAATRVAGFQPTNVETRGFNDLTPEQLQGYMNPYTENVLDVQKRRATQTFEEQQASRDASAVAAGAFGGDRRFVSDSLAQRDLNDQIQGIDAAGLEAAFNNAAGMFQTDEARRTGVNVGNADRGLDAAGLGLNAATVLGGLGQTRNDINMQNAEALSGVGSKIQQRKQAGLDMAYKDFQDQRDWPTRQLSLYSQLLSGTPVTPNTSTTTTQPAPDFLSQLLGLAVGGAGVWDLLN